MDSRPPILLNYHASADSPPRWVWQLLLIWAVLCAGATAPMQAWFLRHGGFALWHIFGRWTPMHVYRLLQRYLEVGAAVIAVVMLAERRSVAMRITRTCVLGWCALRVLADLYIGVMQERPTPANYGPHGYLLWMIGRFGDLSQAIPTITVPLVCLILLRTDPPWRRAWRVLVALTVAVAVSKLIGFLTGIIVRTDERYLTSFWALQDVYQWIFESAPVLIVLLLRRWRWMPVAILAHMLEPILAARGSGLYTKSLPLAERVAIAADVVIALALIAVTARLWRNLNRVAAEIDPATQH